MVCQRPEGKRYGLMWEFPGGKIQNGESPAEAVARELKEELGLSVVRVGTVLYSHLDPGSGFLIEFMEVEVQGSQTLHEHAAVAWETLEQLPAYALAPSD
jgi:8-oxo-dGTP diphosphatase